MAQVPGNDQVVDGKSLLPKLAVGCLVFAVIMSAGVYFFAQATTPFFAEMAKKNAPRSSSSPSAEAR